MTGNESQYRQSKGMEIYDMRVDHTHSMQSDLDHPLCQYVTLSIGVCMRRKAVLQIKHVTCCNYLHCHFPPHFLQGGRGSCFMSFTIYTFVRINTGERAYGYATVRLDRRIISLLNFR